MAMEDWQDHDDFFTDRPYPTAVPKNHGKPWSTKDDKRLVMLLKSTDDIGEIAEFFSRSEHAIVCRIEYLATAQERKDRLARNIAALRAAAIPKQKKENDGEAQTGN